MDYIHPVAAPQFEKKNIRFIIDCEGLRHLALYVDRLRINKVMLLNHVGIQVEAAEDGQVGFEMFAASKPGYYSAILMDIRMPRLDGLHAARQIRSLDRLDACTIPILAMTANAYAEDVQATIEAGMNKHLSKPIDPALLYSALAKLMVRGNE